MYANSSPAREKLILPDDADLPQKKPIDAIDWPDIICRWESSGIPQREFCQQYALHYNSFVFQRMQLKKARKAQQAKRTTAPRLLPVTKVEEPANAVSVSAGFMVQWPNGVRLSVPLHADAATLNALLTQLGG